MNSILSVQDLCLWYGSHQALKDINIEIPEKSITALIGPSGCGKSTFLKTLDRMNDLIPDVKITGSVLYKGEDIFDSSVDVSELRRQVGMVFQKPNPFPMSIYDNIAYGPRTHGVRSKARLDEIVEQSAAQDVDVHFILVDIDAVQQDIAGNAAALDKVVHTVEAFQKGGFTAAGRTDKGGNLLFGDCHIDVF